MQGTDYDWFKVTWFVLFFTFGFYLLINMLLAIIMGAYEETKNEMGSADVPEVLHVRRWHYFAF